MRVACLALAMIFSASQASAQAEIRGYVREDSTLRPLANVEVVADSAGRPARTDESGRFTLRDVKSGRRQIEVRRVGYQPLSVSLDVGEGRQEQVFYLKRTVQTLDPTTVRANRPRGIAREGFEERRLLGFGRFLDSVALRNAGPRRLPDLLRAEGLRIFTPDGCNSKLRPPYCDQNSSKRVAVAPTSTTACPMEVILDGVTVYRARTPPAGSGRNVVEWAATFDLTSVQTSSLESIEIYRRTAEIPMEFSAASASCGLLVMWTRRR